MLARLFVLSIALSSYATGASLPKPGLEHSLAQARAKQISQVTYDLSIYVPEEPGKKLIAKADVHFRLKSGANSVVLDFKEADPKIIRFTVNGRKAAYTLANQHLLLREGIRQGRNSVSLEFETSAASVHRRPDFVYSLFVPDRASQAFPSFDQPDIKASFKLLLTVPKGWIAMSNEKVVWEYSGESTTKIQFAPTLPISTYLFAFAAGKFRSAQEGGERPMRVFYRESDAQKVERNLPELFRLHRLSLEKLEAYTDVRYPFSKFDFVLIPSFPYGGMEHPGAIFYNEGRMLLDETATVRQKLGRALTIAHETAHMWFGDLVTMRWFNDVWLKEVMANFFAAKLIEPLFPEHDHSLKFFLSHYPGAYEIDRSQGANPIRQKLENLQNAGSVYGPIIYLKSPIVMRQLEQTLGEEKFQEGIRDYLAKFRFQNADWNELVGIFQSKTRINLRKWSRSWVEEPGRPEISIQERAGELIVRQADSSRRGQLWPQQFQLLAMGEGFENRETVVLAGEKASLRIRNPPQFVLANSDGVGYGFFRLDERSRDFLLKHLNDLRNPLARAVAWSHLWDEAYAGRVGHLALSQLALRSLASEDQSLIQDFMLKSFRHFFWSYMSPAERAEITPLWEKALWQLLESKDAKTVKPTAFLTLRGIASSEESLDRLEKIFKRGATVEGLPLSERDEISLAYSLALHRPTRSAAILNEQQARIGNPDTLGEFKFVRKALDPNEENRKEFFHSLRLPENRKLEDAVQEALVLLGHPLRGDTDFMVQPGLEWLEEIRRTNDIFFPQDWLNGLFSGRQSAKAASIVRQFLKKRPEYPADLKAKILQSADDLFRTTRQ